MQSLIFGGHPNGEESGSYQFLKEATPSRTQFVQIPTEITAEMRAEHQQLILDTDRLFIQFPFFWYQAPGLVSNWLTEIFEKDFLVLHADQLKGKDFGIVLIVGVPLRHYQAGGRERFTISELLKPYQAFANAMKFNYLAPFVLAQHSYQTEAQQKLKLVEFQQYISLVVNPNFQQRSLWLVDQLERIGDKLEGIEQAEAMLIVDEWRDNLDNLEMLELQLPKTTWR